MVLLIEWNPWTWSFLSWNALLGLYSGHLQLLIVDLSAFKFVFNICHWRLSHFFTLRNSPVAFAVCFWFIICLHCEAPIILVQVNLAKSFICFLAKSNLVFLSLSVACTLHLTCKPSIILFINPSVDCEL